jgi:cell surface protein SprA
MGSFSISFISYQTMFSKFDPNEVSETFKQFEANRATLSQRLKGENVYAQNNPVGPDGYVQGYGRYAQDVLIPAFLAAYTDKDPNSISLIKSANPSFEVKSILGIAAKTQLEYYL